MLIIMTPLYCDHHRLEIAAKSGKKIKRQSVVSQGEIMMIIAGTCEAEQFSRRRDNVMYVMLLLAGLPFYCLSITFVMSSHFPGENPINRQDPTIVCGQSLHSL